MKKTALIIKQRREKTGLKQKDLAEQLGITTSYMSLIESGKREPSLKLRRKISKHLNIPLSALVLSDIQSLASNKHEREIEKLVTDLYEKLSAQS